jgi:LPS sulfotransferase NodH
VDTLNRSPGVAAYGELFQPGRVKGFTWGARGFPSYVSYRRDGGRSALRYLRTWLEGDQQATAAGFKLMYRHAVQHPQVMAYLRMRGVRVLHLVRTNSVDVAFSRAALERAHGHSTDPDAAPHADVAVDPARVVADARAHRRSVRTARAILRGVAMRHLEVSYEELCDDPAAILGRTGAFLGLPQPPTPGASPLRKLAGRQGQGVSNLDEVRRALERAGFGHLLDA